MVDIDNSAGSISFAIRLLGNEVIGFEMRVDSLRTKWLVLSLGAIVVVTWVASILVPIVKNLNL